MGCWSCWYAANNSIKDFVFYFVSLIFIVSMHIDPFENLKDKKGITITNAFQEKLDQSKCKTNNIWMDNGSELYNRSMKL